MVLTKEKEKHTLLPENLEPAPSPEPELVPVVIRHDESNIHQPKQLNRFFSWSRKMEEGV